MTTEILRNIMYRQADTERNPEREDRLATVGLVVLDEVRCLLLILLLSHVVLQEVPVTMAAQASASRAASCEPAHWAAILVRLTTVAQCLFNL